ncbi:MAG: response regulator transcription factor [Planctomycetes bacterium]|nr:response regulator transcription factor [Planctomycetota bacterium]
MGVRLCIVEDDRSLRETLADAFTLEGYEVETAADGNEATTLLFGRHFDVVILDVMLPGRGGFEILRDLRAERLSTPVLMLTVRSEENDKVLGLELGADDYLTKPFSLRELVARVKALVRRQRQDFDAKATVPRRFHVGPTEVDLERYALTRGDDQFAISPREARILEILFQASGRVVTRDAFLQRVWGPDAPVGNRTIDTHVLNLRQKLEPDSASPQYLLTVHGVGYRLVT